MPKFRLIHAVTTLALLSFGLCSLAQEWRKEELSVVDNAFMSKQKESINNLTRRHFGRQLTGKKSNDFPLLQRLLDEQRVKPQEVQILQAMGVIFGDILRTEKSLRWIIYIDKYGRSRALNIPNQRDVIFPITMISRRVEVGAKVDINELYQKAEVSLETIKKQIIVY